MGVKNDNSSNNKKPYLYYYCIVLLIVMVLNALVFPSVMERSVEVPFNEFTTQLSSGNVEQVYVNGDNTEIMYTLKQDKGKSWTATTYKTGNMTTADDLVNRQKFLFSALLKLQRLLLPMSLCGDWELPCILWHMDV